LLALQSEKPHYWFIGSTFIPETSPVVCTSFCGN